MFKLVTRRRMRELVDEAEDLKEKCKQLDKHNHRLSEEVDALQASLDQSKEEIEKVKQENEALSDLSTQADTNEVIVRVGDDLMSLTPIIRWKGEETTEKLIELGYLKDSNATKTATQVALMLIAHEGLEQIIEDFHPQVNMEDV